MILIWNCLRVKVSVSIDIFGMRIGTFTLKRWQLTLDENEDVAAVYLGQDPVRAIEYHFDTTCLRHRRKILLAARSHKLIVGPRQFRDYPMAQAE